MFWTQKILVSLMFFLGAGITAVGLYFKDDITEKLSKTAYSFARYPGGSISIDNLQGLITSIVTSGTVDSAVLSTLSLSTDAAAAAKKLLESLPTK